MERVPRGLPLTEYLQGRVVVVSPHLDDAVLSLGATIAAAVQQGADVTVLTVLCGDPFSQTPAGPWDRNSGFASEGEAARVRREEDRRACAILGAKPRWLPFADEQYDRHGDEQEITAALRYATTGADMVLVPGWPLVNPDHAWLNTLLLGARTEGARLGIYVEQPYAFQAPGSALGPAHSWQRLPVRKRDRQLKRKAIEAYESQLRQLGLGYIGLGRMLADERSQGGEALSWVSPAEAQPLLRFGTG